MHVYIAYQLRTLITHNDYLYWTRSPAARKKSSRAFTPDCNKACCSCCKPYGTRLQTRCPGRPVHPSCTAVHHGRRRNGTAFTLRTSQYCNPPTESSCNEKTSVARHGCPGFSSSRSSKMLLQVLRAVHEVLSFADCSCIPHSSRGGNQRKRLYHRLPTSPALDHSTCAGIVERVRGTFCTRMNGHRSTTLISVAAKISLKHTFSAAFTFFILNLDLYNVAACHYYLFVLLNVLLLHLVFSRNFVQICVYAL